MVSHSFRELSSYCRINIRFFYEIFKTFDNVYMVLISLLKIGHVCISIKPNLWPVYLFFIYIFFRHNTTENHVVSKRKKIYCVVEEARKRSKAIYRFSHGRFLRANVSRQIFQQFLRGTIDIRKNVIPLYLSS